MNKAIELWFSAFWIVVMVLMAMLLLSGCTLPYETDNYNPTPMFKYAYPDTWDHPHRIELE